MFSQARVMAVGVSSALRPLVAYLLSCVSSMFCWSYFVSGFPQDATGYLLMRW